MESASSSRVAKVKIAENGSQNKFFPFKDFDVGTFFFVFN
jgi:hypothetical protein